MQSIVAVEGYEQIYSRERIEDELDVIAHLLNAHLAGKKILVCPILLGGMVFAGKLMTRLTFETRLDFLQMARYEGKRAEAPTIISTPSFRNKNVLILDEIYDEGETLTAAAKAAWSDGALSVTSAVLVARAKSPKRDQENIAVVPDVVGILHHGSEYLVGEGLDLNGQYRNLPGIWRPTC